jgi:4-hydroxybenzoate polyprenyltransferase
MVFNDVFDRKQDLAERPGRPIPSGRVSVKSAIILGVIFMMIGIAAAAIVCPVSLQVALLLAVMILAYDGLLKPTILGPLAMGSCRFLNILLGASVQENWQLGLLSQPQLAAAIGMGVYIIGVTLFARTEATTSSQRQLGLANVVINVGFAVFVALILTSFINSPKEITLAMLLVVAFTVNRRASKAVYNPSPANVQSAIKVMLLSIVLIDATLVFWYLNTPDSLGYGAVHALLTASLVIPALILSRLIPMT